MYRMWSDPWVTSLHIVAERACLSTVHIFLAKSVSPLSASSYTSNVEHPCSCVLAIHPALFSHVLSSLFFVRKIESSRLFLNTCTVFTSCRIIGVMRCHCFWCSGHPHAAGLSLGGIDIIFLLGS